MLLFYCSQEIHNTSGIPFMLPLTDVRTSHMHTNTVDVWEYHVMICDVTNFREKNYQALKTELKNFWIYLMRSLKRYPVHLQLYYVVI